MNLHSKEKMLLLGIIVCAFIVTAGYSFAYFTTGVSVVNNGGNGVSASTDKLQEVVYDAGSKILSLVDAYPSKKASKDFSISFTPTETLKSTTYAIKLNISSNSFVKCSDANYDVSSNACIKEAEELVYTLKSGNTVLATGDLTAKTGDIEVLKETKTADVKTIYDYTLELEFRDINGDQNHNMNKSLSATLSVEFAE